MYLNGDAIQQKHNHYNKQLAGSNIPKLNTDAVLIKSSASGEQLNTQLKTISQSSCMTTLGTLYLHVSIVYSPSGVAHDQIQEVY